MNTQEYEYHEIANIFPMLETPELGELTEDIRRNGLREPIWLYEGKILDGRNRYEACKHAWVYPEFREYEGEDPVGFVVSLNLHRRHLSESQRGMVGASIARLERGSNQHGGKVDAQICASSIATQEQVAGMLNVGRTTIQSARKVQDQGTPELVAEVVKGNVAVSTAAKIAELPKEEQAEIVARGPKEILEAAKQIRADKAKEIRAQRIDKIAKIAEGNTELPTGKKYAVVYADPPWRYDVVISTSREIENHYPTMSIEDICSMPVVDLTTPDAIIFLWVTSPLLEKGITVLNAWGFDYKSSFVWVKDRIGMGFYNRTQHEFLLVGTKGKIPAPSPEHRVSSVINATRGEHSEKPEVVSSWIETWYEGLPKIELFCRSPRIGWDVWGNQSAIHAEESEAV